MKCSPLLQPLPLASNHLHSYVGSIGGVTSNESYQPWPVGQTTRCFFSTESTNKPIKLVALGGINQSNALRASESTNRNERRRTRMKGVISNESNQPWPHRPNESMLSFYRINQPTNQSNRLPGVGFNQSNTLRASESTNQIDCPPSTNQPTKRATCVEKSTNRIESRQEGVQRAEGLIKYMTPEERRTPKLLILDPTSQARCRRIAKDAGVKLSAVSVSLCFDV